MLGTIINVCAVVVGGLVGSLLGDRLPERTRETVMSGIGLVTMVMGMQMALSTRNMLIVLGSILLGAILGEWWGIERALERLGQRVEARVRAGAPAAPAAEPGREPRSIGRAFVMSSLVFCVGPMAILGSVQDGLTGDHNLLVLKSVLDGFSALAFSAALGPGVIISALSLLIYQGSMSLAAMGMAGSLGHITRDNPAIIEMTATGGVLVMGISLILLNLRQLRVANLLPAVVLAPLAVVVLRALGLSQ